VRSSAGYRVEVEVLLEAGVRTVVDLTEEGELPQE
jgi:hypothetical protein